MRKIFVCFAALLMTLSLSAANYGILVNSKYYFASSYIGQDPFGGGFEQYLSHVQLSEGDYCQLCDPDNSAVWAVDLDNNTVDGFTRNGDRYEVSVSGCYDFYIKIKWQADQLYIGPGSDCGEGVDISGQGGGQGGGEGEGGEQGQGGEDEDDVNYYAMGWINGADHGDAASDVYEDDLMFVDGKLTINCQYGSYIGIKDHTGNYYRSKRETTIADTQVTLDWQDGSWFNGQQWAIPEGINYIIIRKATWKGQIKLERVDKATYDAYHYGSSQDVVNTTVTEKAYKQIIDGQLRIVRGDKVFDATGRQL